MPHKEEHMQILHMLKDGKISVEDAASLLEAVDSGSDSVTSSPTTLNLKVYEDDKEKVNINVPMSLARLVVKLVPKEYLDDDNLDLEALFKNVQAGMRGKLVEIKQPEERRIVEIHVE